MNHKSETYNPHWLFKNRHLNTIWSSKIRKVKTPAYRRQKIATADQDFIAIDTLIGQNSSAVILVHGFEGSTDSTYIKSMSLLLQQNQFDVFAVNLRGCSGEPNLVEGYYNSGRTEDLETVIQFVQNNYNYDSINLIGFSLGGNLVIKYVGETTNSIINKAIGVSVPCNLKTSSIQLEKGLNKIYNRRFVKSLQAKLLYKAEHFPDFPITKSQILSAKTVYEIDDLYTAPIHGYLSADDYYKKCSCKQFIKNIQIPTLLINALDDQFLTPECYPFEEAKNNSNFNFVTPKYGGHLGFMTSINDTILWHEKRIMEFLNS